MRESSSTSPSEPCVICKRVATEPLLVTSDRAAAFADAYPLTTGHTLVVPRRHEPDFFSLTEEEQQELWRVVALVRIELDRERRPAGYNIGINAGAAAGQTVAHAHIHVIPRYEGDVEDPRGGIRWVIPERAAWWREGG